MYRSSFNLLLISLVGLLGSCTEQEPKVPENGQKIAPTLRTEPVQFDTDDPAIWYNANDPANSLILGTDKEVGGGLYVFDLDGKILTDKTVYGLSYPNNVDVEYGFIRKYKVTTAEVHDSQVLGEIIDIENLGNKIWADSAYRSEDV
ncbi:MAG: phytase, partial [Bacteroidota bacterium]